jgi:DNA-binding SARP family transcriptional activator
MYNLPMLHIQTLGAFRVRVDGREIPPTAWSREKALHLLQLLVTLRRQQPHKEQIIETLWSHLDPDAGDRDFRVALNALQNALEPQRPPRAASRYIVRSELNYSLDAAEMQVDADEFDAALAAAHAEPAAADAHYRRAVALYAGDYLPERRYEDWTAAERERLRTLALGALTRLAGRLLPADPLEAVRLARRALELDPLWENAYRIEMQAHLASGNRPLAIRAYEQCARLLREEYGLEPLPETRQLYQGILRGKG